jgi:aspartyl-tRNA(Asn)/glutamyl-tRNA(Gln) amidotransferase subunit A
VKHATEIAAAVRARRTTATAVVERCLAALMADDNRLVAVTRVLAERARHEAALVDAAIAAGRDPGPLAGVPYGVKDLFDVAGLPTTAGSELYAGAAPATTDAVAIQRLGAAGAVLVATLNMDEFAYGFATINAVHGTTRNPYDLSRIAGGSSGGSAAVVAAGLLPFTLGSDTNGSIRVPASLTGIYGLKPTHDALPMAGVFPFAKSFDDIGPFATSPSDLALLWDVLRAGSGRSDTEIDPVRVARLGGRFAVNLDPAQQTAIDAIAPDAPMVDLGDVARARSAAFLITAFEGGAVHRAAFARGEAMRFDPATRDRLLAGALLPDALYDRAQAFRTAFKDTLASVFAEHDILIAPAAPCVAPTIADPWIVIDGERTPARRDLGVHSQPISFAGLPALAVPLKRPGQLPLGLQLIGRPGGEQMLFRFAEMLEERGLTGVCAPGEAFQGDSR